MRHVRVRVGLYEAMAGEVERRCGPRYKPDPESLYERAGSDGAADCMLLEERVISAAGSDNSFCLFSYHPNERLGLGT